MTMALAGLGLVRNGLIVGLMLGPVAGIAAEPSIDSHKLGVTESLVSYCQRVDTADAAKLKIRAAGMIQGASAATLLKVRRSEEYRQGFDQVNAFVAKVDSHNAARPCSAAVAAGR